MTLIIFVIVVITACVHIDNRELYTPLEGGVAGAVAQTRGSIDGDLAWARSARNIAEAASRWKEFLDRWDTEVEDGYAQLRIDLAKLELARVYYLLGRVQEGDQILKQIDPLQLR